MNELVLFDTDVLIDLGRGIEDAVSALEQVETRFATAVSTVTHMELIVGCRSKVELRALDHFLARFRVLPLDEAISARAVELLRHYRLSHGLLPGRADCRDGSFAGNQARIEKPAGLPFR